MNIPLETIEAEILANWMRANNYMFTHIPNETYTKSWNQKRKNTLEWVSPWFPDYCILLKIWALLFIELKRQRNVLKNWKIWNSPSTISEKQIQWIESLHSIENVEAHICYWAEESIKLIKEIEWQ